MADEFGDLRLFVRMVQAGNLSRTAEQLNSSLPAMSRRLAAMEERLGVRLVSRTTRRFALTEEGNLLFQRGMAILAELDETEAELSAHSAAPRGHLRVGAPLEIGRRRYAPLMAEFVRQYPRVSVELALSDSLMDVIGDSLDVGLLVGEPADNSVIARKLISSRRVICASPAYLAAHGTPATPQDLLAHDCILLVRGRHIFDRWQFLEGGRLFDVRVHGSLLSNNGEVMHEWVLDGRGIGLKALWDIEEDLAVGRLVEVLGKVSHEPINLYAVYPTRSFLPPRVRLFLDFMVAATSQQQQQQQQA